MTDTFILQKNHNSLRCFYIKVSVWICFENNFNFKNILLKLHIIVIVVT